ncbi:Uracil-DNA glycosylase [Planctomycetales bacterium 10988]|nr:Uracil-DNA glycosylase [Planctomycetales bacterium 10988]
MSTSTLQELLPEDWRVALREEFEKEYFQKLEEFVAKERAEQTIFPPQGDEFAALKWTPLAEVKVLLLGQDPYHGPGQAHGASFSVLPEVRTPPSLRNIYKELKEDLHHPIPNHGYLKHWAEQGVLLLNAVLTVRASKANSHKGKGWESFTDAIIRVVNEKPSRVVFLLWGGYARKKAPLIDTTRHRILESAHPSPLSAKNGFFGSRPFSYTNQLLEEVGKEPINWEIPKI